MSVARPLLRALLRAEAAWRRAARESAQRSAAAASASLPSSTSFASSLHEAAAGDPDPEPPTTTLRFREPMDTSAWQRGRHGWALGGESYHLQAARAALGGGSSLPLGPPTSGVFRGTELRRLILQNFRAAEAAFKRGFLDLSAAEDAGFAALRALGEQRAMERCSSASECANGVRVEATAALVAALPSSPFSPSSSRFLSSSSGSMRSVTSAGPGIIVITSVEEGSGSSDEDEDDEDQDEEESDDDDESAAGRVRGPRAASGAPPPSPAPEMRYVFTYRLRISNTNPPLPDDDEEEEEEEDEEGGEEDRNDTERQEKNGAPAATEVSFSATSPASSSIPGLRVQLLTRGWQIRDSSGRLHAAVPKGSPGVVGCTPVLSPGETFEYYSSTDLPTPAGVMSGSFGMTVVGVGGENGGGGSGGSGSSSGGSESGKKKRRRRRKLSPPPSLLSTVASRRFEAVVAPFALRADPLKR